MRTTSITTARPPRRNSEGAEAGFSLIELIVATALLLIVSSIVTSALLQMTSAQKTIWNRTEMHSGIRGATELLQQEVGQAGRISFPSTVTLNAAVGAATCNLAAPATNAVTVAVNSSSAGISAVAGMYANNVVGNEAYIMLTTMDGDNSESFRVASFNAGTTPPTITACFSKAHPAGTVIQPMGGFATGIIPPAGIVNPSTANVLKLFGDINGDGNMVYVEYTCDNGDAGTVGTHNLYRNVMAFNAAAKPALDNSMILLNNIYPNDPDTGGVARPCFKYQTVTITTGTPATNFTFVTDVAVTLTVQTEQIDPVTRQYQKETKALLNVSPRNVFNTWAYAGLAYTDRIQSTPATVVSLLAPAP